MFGYPSVALDPSGDKETYQAGGNLQVVQGRLATTVSGSPITDPTGLGRWSGITLEGRRSQKLSVITAYRTCDGSISTAPHGSTFHREYTYYKDQGEASPQPRRRFLQDIHTAIETLQTNNHAVLLMLDANSTLDSDSHFLSMINNVDLTDLHQSSAAPSTYIGSSNRRIDYMLGCPRIQAVVSRQGSLAYFEGPHSDHRALYVDLNLKTLFDLDLDSVELAAAALRSLRTGNPELVDKYIMGMKKYYEDHNMKARIDRLSETHQTMSRAAVRAVLISWDQDQGRAMSSAEGALRVQPKPHQWSPTLRNLAFIMRYWKLRLREQVYMEEYSRTFARWELQLQAHDSTFVFPHKNDVLTTEKVRSKFTAATKQFRKAQSE